MAAKDKTDTAKSETKKFTCTICSFDTNYHYYGKKPPFAKSLKFLEDCYVMKDPFSNSGGLITIGANCSHCGVAVCMSSDCSLFYSKRFCFPCVLKNLEEFPNEILEEVLQKQRQDDR